MIFDWIVLLLTAKNYTITEAVGRDFWRSSSPTPPLKQVPYSILHRKVSRWVLNMSREGNSTISLLSLFQSSVTLMVKMFS